MKTESVLGKLSGTNNLVIGPGFEKRVISNVIISIWCVSVVRGPSDPV